MNSSLPFTASPENGSARVPLSALLAHLHRAQHPDGGWPFHAGGRSRVEPTCWALLVFANSSASAQPNIAGGLHFLRSQQLPDGSWPSADGISSGGWVTSLAALTLAQFPACEKSVHVALEWLSDDYPRDSSRWQKFLKSFGTAKQHVSHNDEFRGWGWTPRTSSWVEPTAFALLAFAAVRAKTPAVGPGSASEPGILAELARQISDRRALAIGLLYDRMCAGGGWNCGNPRVYGVDGESLILPTCWALLALRTAPEHPNRTLSLSWLQKSFATIASAASLAVAQLTLENYDLPVPSAPRQLTDFSAAELSEQGTHVASWAALALNSSRAWPLRFYESTVTNQQSPATSHLSQP
jgi:hypothetical protein